MAATPTTLTLDGRALRITNPDKVMYPATGTTKGDVIGYYAAVAPWLVPHLAGRPATRKRWVHGVDGHAFFTKNVDSGTPDWVRTVTIQHSVDTSRYPVVDDAATLVFLAQLAALEIHVPQWRFDDHDVAQPPDRLVLDLDPGEGAGLPECVTLALIVKEILDEVGLVSVPVTSGSKGIHLYAGLDGHLTPADASAFARQLATSLEGTHPDLVVSDMKKELRGGKVLLDWSQNNGSKTTVAPYSLRGRQQPYVAAPRTWDEIGPELRQLTYLEVLERLATLGDPLAALLPDAAPSTAPTADASRPKAALAESPPAAVRVADDRSPTAGSASDRLDTYRAKRDASRTPEPVPAQSPSAGAGDTFVIQEHHARRLHHDFRLEHDGVLVSWAVPKLTPLRPKENHLAVQTEDHPLEYGSFAGTIPAGEYGAGEVTIWDAGTYELEKWRDGAEVIATLHGRPDGGLGGVPRTYVLIHTAHGDDDKNWLIHLKADAPTTSVPTPAASPRSESSALAEAAVPAASAKLAAPAAPGDRTPAALPDVAPMLATAATRAEVAQGDWHFEVKWDGYRGIARVAGGAWTMASRKGIDFTDTYPELGELAAWTGAHEAVFDGEIVALGPDGRSHFELLQNHGRGTAAAHYMIFDLLWLDGQSLVEHPYLERRALLEGTFGEGGTFVHVPTTFGADRDLAFEASTQLELEGVVAKRPESTYAPGRRSRAWLKVKNVRHQEVIVVGWTPGEGNRASTLGSLILAVNGDDGLAFAGSAGSGFTERGLAEALHLLQPLAVRDAPVAGVPRSTARTAHWVRPELVGEVSYGDWTSTGQLRHPVWRGWRPDRSPEEVRRE